MEGASHKLLSMHRYGLCLERLRKTTAISVSVIHARFLVAELGFAIPTGPILRPTQLLLRVGIVSVPWHRRYCRGKQKVSRDCGFPQALPCLHFGKGILALRSSMEGGQFRVGSWRKKSLGAEFGIGVGKADVRAKM